MPIILTKAQLKIQQMSFMLIALTIFFSLVLLFYVAVRASGLQGDKEQLDREKAVALVTKIASSPEFSFEDVPRAVDFDKLMVLRRFGEYEREGKNFWGVKGIIVKKIYPAGEEVECKLSNYPACNTIKLFTDETGEFIYSYVAICMKENSEDNLPYNNCGLGLIMLNIGDENDS